MKYYLDQSAPFEEGNALHNENCSDLSELKDPIYLGSFDNYKEALKIAKEYYPQTLICPKCCQKENCN